ncbi:MAG TPA: tetratricopeptide repeat protein, partial [Myxococcaceae bacterium]|nr:tetratricopeptide repeat protein [Myxococcaceae bacterium]
MDFQAFGRFVTPDPMSTPTPKNLSPAELAKLEHAFASDPSSTAYKPLAEAYLGMGRFMEAMVVCKKGVKAHPNAPDPRVLLARVYAEQGKDKKALEELTGALQIAPQDKQVLRMTGVLQMKAGQADEGKANLLKAYRADPVDAETQAALTEWKVDPPRDEPPTEKVQTAPATPAAPIAGPGTRRPGSAETGGRTVTGEMPRPQERSASPAPGRTATASSMPAAGGPSRTTSGVRPAVRYTPDDEDDGPAEPVRRRGEPSKPGRSRIFFALLGVMAVVVVGYAAFGRWRALNNNAIKKDLAEATKYLKNDSYDSYQKAAEAAERVLERDPDSVAAHGYLAYAWAIRWGEHGGGDEARKQAEEHLAAAKEGGEVSSHAYAAEALIKSYSGQGAEALTQLQERVRAAGGKGALLNLTLGLLQTNAGDLEGARESLERAQALASDDPRVYSALGALYRRRGELRQARSNYNFALQYHDQKAHPEAMLGKAALLLESDRPNYEEAAKLLGGLLKSEPRPSPRQLAVAQMTRGLLISALSRNLANYKPDDQRKLTDATGTPMDRAAAGAEVVRAEEAAFQLDRQNPELRLLKGKRLLGEGQVDPAIAELRQAVKMDPTRAQFSVELAQALIQKPGGEREAEEALHTALRTLKDSPRLLALLGNALRKQGKVDEALTQYTRAVTDPKVRNPDARLGMGLIYLDRKDFPKAQEALEKAARESVGQPARLATIYAELGRVYEAKGDRGKAEEVFMKALNEDAEYAPAYFFYARFLAQD